MDNKKLVTTIYEFIKYCDKYAEDIFEIYIRQPEDLNIQFINRWVEEVWSKEQL